MEGDGGWEEGEGEGEVEGWEEAGEGGGEEGGEEGEGDTETSPMFVPKKGVFFQHDDRYGSTEDKEQEEK